MALLFMAAGSGLAATGGESGLLWVVTALLGVRLIQDASAWRAAHSSASNSDRTQQAPVSVEDLSKPGIHLVRDPDGLDAVFTHPELVLFKHSTRCPVSSSALRQVLEYAGQDGSLPVAQINVIESRALSNEVEQRTGIRHASPQVILLRGGEASGDMSHGRIRVEALQQLQEDRGA